MRVRPSRYLIFVITLAIAACQHPFTQEDARAAIEHHDTLRRLLAPDSVRVAHETVADCRAIYSDDPRLAEIAGDSAWILLSSAGWLDLADVDAPSDSRQKKHCRAVLTSKADKAAFHEPQNPGESPWTSYWTVETAHPKLELFDSPSGSTRGNSAVADFEITRQRTAIAELLHRPAWSDTLAGLLSTTLTGHFRHYDDGWRLESFEEKQ
jgi:hypothetical protein